MDKIMKSILIMLFFVALNLQANILTDSLKVIDLQEVIVKGDARNDPTLTIVKSDFTSKATQPKNSGELFSDINGFSLIKRGNYAVDPTFRASQYEQLNIQFDGGTKALHACPNRMDPITTLVNPEEVTRIEIIKGPFSVRYGPVFGAVVNMVTNDKSTNTKPIAGSVSSGYERNGNSMVNNVSLKSNLKIVDLAANYSHKVYGNYTDGNGAEIPSSFKNDAYSLKAGVNLTENQRIQAGFRQSYGRDILHAGLPMDTKLDNSTIADVDYNLLLKSKSLKSLTAKAYYSFVDHVMNNFSRSTFAASSAEALVNATTTGAKMETSWDIGSKIKLFTGVDYSGLSRMGNRTRILKKNMAGVVLPNPMTYIDKVWQNSTLYQAGAFAEGKYFISKNDILNYGIRVDFVTANATDLDPQFAALYPTQPVEQNDVNISGTIALQHKFNDNVLMEAAFGRGVRSASIEERYIAFFNIGRDAYEYIGNPYLKPEINNQIEINLKGTNALTGFFNKIDYGISVYDAFLQDYIMGVVDNSLTRKYSPTVQPVNPKVFRNIERAFKAGFEAYTKLQFAKSFNLSADVSYVFTENTQLKESLPLTPPLLSHVKLEYERKLFWANLRLTLSGAQNRISTVYNEMATPAYELLDAEFGIIPFKNFKIGFAGLNLFNKYYVNHLTFAFNNIDGFGRVPIPEPGRNLTVFASYSF